jgi:hypothetical protein
MKLYVQRAISPKTPMNMLRQIHQAIATKPMVFLGKAWVFLRQVGQGVPLSLCPPPPKLMIMGPPGDC